MRVLQLGFKPDPKVNKILLVLFKFKLVCNFSSPLLLRLDLRDDDSLGLLPVKVRGRDDDLVTYLPRRDVVLHEDVVAEVTRGISFQV